MLTHARVMLGHSFTHAATQQYLAAPQTPAYVSSYSCRCVLTLLHVSAYSCMCPHTRVCVRILVYLSSYSLRTRTLMLVYSAEDRARSLSRQAQASGTDGQEEREAGHVQQEQQGVFVDMQCVYVSVCVCVCVCLSVCLCLSVCVCVL